MKLKKDGTKDNRTGYKSSPARPMYVIVKFHQSRRPRVQPGYGFLTEEEAQKICQDPKTSSHGNLADGKNWFLGYDEANRW